MTAEEEIARLKGQVAALEHHCQCLQEAVDKIQLFGKAVKAASSVCFSEPDISLD